MLKSEIFREQEEHEFTSTLLDLWSSPTDNYAIERFFNTMSKSLEDAMERRK